MNYTIKNWEKIVEELYNNNIIGYKIFELDLSIPRKNEPFQVVGNFLQVLDIPQNPPKIEIIFNDIFEYPIQIKEKEQFVYPFRKFFITNDIGNGKLKLFVGKNFELTPYSKLTLNISDITQKLDEIINKLDNISIDADTINLNTDELENKIESIRDFLTYIKYDTLKLNDINGYLQNIYNGIDYLTSFLNRSIGRKVLVCHNTILQPNNSIDLNMEPNGRFFGISNLSDTDNILVYFGYPYYHIKLKYNSSFSTDKPITNNIKILNNSSNPVEINYWYTTEP